MSYRKNYWKEIAECIEYIEAEVNVGSSYTKIMSGIDQKYNTRMRVVHDAFDACMPYSLCRYIKRRMYTVRYLKWLQNPIKLTTRTQVEGVQKFSQKFANEFGVEISEGLDECTLQPKLQVEEIKRVHEGLERMPVVNSFKISGDSVYLEKNYKEILKQMLRFKSYFLPERMESEFRKLDQDAKMLFLIVTTHAIKSEDPYASTPLSKLHIEMDTMRFYDFRSYNILNNGYMVFVPKLSASYYKVFLNCCEELLPDIKAVIPSGSICGDLKREVYAISEAGTLEDITKATEISDPRPVIWQYLCWGYLRLTDVFAMTLYS